MSPSVLLHDVAHCRAGDKGDDSLLAVFPYARGDYQQLVLALRSAPIADHFGVPTRNVEINEAPTVGGLVVVVRGCLAGGVTRSTRADAHGKTLSSRLLTLEVQWAEVHD